MVPVAWSGSKGPMQVGRMLRKSLGSPPGRMKHCFGSIILPWSLVPYLPSMLCARHMCRIVLSELDGGRPGCLNWGTGRGLALGMGVDGCQGLLQEAEELMA